MFLIMWFFNYSRYTVMDYFFSIVLSICIGGNTSVFNFLI